jgi:glutamine synthetase
VECRIPGADANPYLVYAALLAAGLDGIERGLDPGPAFQGDVYAAEDLPRVPSRLGDAIEALEASAFARKALGDAVVEHYLHFARSERRACEARVSDIERARYFERI